MTINRLTLSLFCLVGMLSATAAMAETHEHHKQHHGKNHLAVGIGSLNEDQSAGGTVSGGMLGFGYQRALSERWHLATAFEWEAFSDSTERHTVVFLGVGYNITERWRTFAGPGVEGRKLGEREHVMFRIGTAYQIPVTPRFSVSPELYVDLLEDDNRVYVFSLAFGYSF